MVFGGKGEGEGGNILRAAGGGARGCGGRAGRERGEGLVPFPVPLPVQFPVTFPVTFPTLFPVTLPVPFPMPLPAPPALPAPPQSCPPCATVGG